MVLEIKISNFRSIRDEVILDLRAGNISTVKSKKLSSNLFQFNEIDVLKTVALYGPNASGKSNIIKAIRFFHHLIFESHNFNQNVEFNCRPFKFDDYLNKPSTYSIRFVAENIEYLYSFSMNKNGILTEKLHHYPNGKKAKVFTRNERKSDDKREIYSFGTSVIKRPYDVAESTSDKTLFISRASQMDREIPKIIFNYFHRQFILNYHLYSVKHISGLLNSFKPQLLEGLQLADSDIIDFTFKLNKQKGRSFTIDFPTEEYGFTDNETEELEIKTFHRSSPDVAFDFANEESLGTQKLFFILLTIIDVVTNNKVLLIDEIEDSLHFKIIEYIITIFNQGDKAQLIFSTHNTRLLDFDKFRKDQIWFVNKKENGASDLYSLYDYNEFRDTLDLEKAYLQGRFDSVPIVSDPAIIYRKKIDG
ncbi:MAG: AAA family ATPase [Flavobacteriales bacterium]|nr:AAA family ATPase [Flavobacteriales bacterium]